MSFPIAPSPPPFATPRIGGGAMLDGRQKGSIFRSLIAVYNPPSDGDSRHRSGRMEPPAPSAAPGKAANTKPPVDHVDYFQMLLRNKQGVPVDQAVEARKRAAAAHVRALPQLVCRFAP